MRKTVATLILPLTLLLATIAVTQFVDLGKANPGVGLTPRESKPILVSIQLPKNDSKVLSDQFILTFIIGNPPFGKASKIVCVIQGFSEVTVDPESHTDSQTWSSYTEYSNYTYSVKVNATGIVDGWHSLSVDASGKYPYTPDQTGIGGTGQEISGSDSTHFLFDVASPRISILSRESRTYIETELPLNFTISEEASWIGYSLDDQKNVSVAGNMTLIDLSEGLHSLVVYANDTLGNMVKSEVFKFTVAKEGKSQLEPFPVIPAIASVSIVALVGVGLLVYFKKRRHREENV